MPNKNIKEYKQILKDFSVVITPEISEHMESIKDNDIRLENYVLYLIKKRLGDNL